jgi:hypothetical protein
MKIRKGFVSNSSSSSFIIIGERVNFKDIDFLTLGNDEEYLALGGGDYFEYGQAVFYLNQKMLDFMKENVEEFDDMDLIFIKSLYNNSECYGDKFMINESQMGKNLKIWAGEGDQWSPNSVEDLKDLMNL